MMVNDDDRLARAAEAFVTEASARARSSDGMDTKSVAPRSAAATADATEPRKATAPSRAWDRRQSGAPTTEAPVAGSSFAPATEGFVDRRGLPGADDPGSTRAIPILSKREWDDTIRHEAARWHRHGRSVAMLAVRIAPASEAVAPVDPPARASTARYDPQAAERYSVPLGDALRRRARSSDRVARLAPDAFSVMLLETGEAGAAAYAERIRSSCEPWIRAVPGDLSLRIGLAVPRLGDSIEGAADESFSQVGSSST